MGSLEIDYSALDSFEPIELLRLPETQSYRSRQSSHELDGDDRLLLKSSPAVHSEYTRRPEHDTGFVRSLKNLRQSLQGWRLGVLLASALASFVLLINCIAAIAIHIAYGTHDGVSTAFEGDCDIVNRWSVGLHIVINILSSALLSASNYTMQVLNAPTRSECDKAHARGHWLDIGITSLHNFTRITWPRRVLWLLLGVSSVPIHLFYNSAAFKTLGANEYNAVVALPLYLQDDFLPDENEWYGMEWGAQDPWVLRREYQSRRLDFVNLTTAECVDIYAVDFVTGHSDVIAVVTGLYPHNHSSVVTMGGSLPGSDSLSLVPYSWICEQITCEVYDEACRDKLSDLNCDATELEKALSGQSGHPFSLAIDYCLAQKTESHCKLQFSRNILVAVIVCNLFKAVAMISTLLIQREPALVTTGDAISSWLQYPDEATANQCLRSARTNGHYTSLGSLPAHGADSDKLWSPVTSHSSKVLRWHQAINRRRWATVLTLCIITLAAAGLVLGMGHATLSEFEPYVLKAGDFGAISAATMLNTYLPDKGTLGLLANVLVANLPQLIFSCLYLLYNGLFTSMCLAHEYSNYSIFRKPLRVTSPRGNQRSTHWLHLPYVYSVPLMVASAVLHWSISQSIFFVGLDVYNGAELYDSHFGLGFSIQPIILDIVLGSLMLLVLVGMGFRKLRGKIPLANSNSFAIAAACHRPEEDKDAALKGVMWGEVQAGSDSEVGHCCFTSMEVTAPVEGKLYAGFRRRV